MSPFSRLDSIALPAVAQLAAHSRGRSRVDRVTDLIGNTPLVRLGSVDAEFPGVQIWAKCEFANPGGSVKDRAAHRMISHAIQRGELRPGVRLIDSTSGNTGIAYSMIGAALGVDVSLVMPSNVSTARKRITRAFGTEVLFSDPMEGSDGAIVQVREMVRACPERWYYPDQYSNPHNPAAHFFGTGAEIWAQTQGRVTHFVTGIGTSGTVMGTSRRLKAESRGRVRCVGVEPDDALHGLEGLKHLATSLVPAIYDAPVLDETIFMDTDTAWDLTARLGTDEGLPVGHSGGANVAAARRIARGLAERGEAGVIVTILPDRGERYDESRPDARTPGPWSHGRGI